MVNEWKKSKTSLINLLIRKMNELRKKVVHSPKSPPAAGALVVATGPNNPVVGALVVLRLLPKTPVLDAAAVVVVLIVLAKEVVAWFAVVVAVFAAPNRPPETAAPVAVVWEEPNNPATVAGWLTVVGDFTVAVPNRLPQTVPVAIVEGPNKNPAGTSEATVEVVFSEPNKPPDPEWAMATWMKRISLAH